MTVEELLEAAAGDGVEMSPKELEQWVSDHPEFRLGRDLYELVVSDNGAASYRCGQHSMLHFNTHDGLMWVVETHPY